MHLCSSIWSGDVSGLCFLQPLMFKPKNYHVLTWKRQTYQVAVYQKDVSGGVEQKTGVGAVVVQEYLDVSAAVSRAGRPDRCRPSRLRRLIADAHSLNPSPLRRQLTPICILVDSCVWTLSSWRLFSPLGTVIDFSLLSFAGKRRLNFIILSQRLGVKWHFCRKRTL